RSEADGDADRRVRPALHASFRAADIRVRDLCCARRRAGRAVSERDTAALVGAFGVFVLWMGASSQLFRFLRPGMRPYVLLAAAALIITSVASFVLQARSRRISVGTGEPVAHAE